MIITKFFFFFFDWRKTFFFFIFFIFIDCSYIYKHYINSVIITLLTDIKTNNTLRTTVTIQCKLTLLEIKEKKELTNASLSYTL